MAGKLTARKVETAKPGKYSDGGNLYLIVSGAGSRKWVLRFTWRGKAKEMGLGSAASVPLADARERAASARRKIALGLNPIDERKRTSGIPTFGEVAADVREALSAGFRNEKHKAQWKVTLETYAESLHAKPVDTIGSENVLAVLKPIWISNPERLILWGEARRVRRELVPVLRRLKKIDDVVESEPELPRSPRGLPRLEIGDRIVAAQCDPASFRWTFGMG